MNKSNFLAKAALAAMMASTLLFVGCSKNQQTPTGSEGTEFFAASQSGVYAAVTEIEGNELELAEVVLNTPGEEQGKSDLQGPVTTPSEGEIPQAAGEARENSLDQMKYTSHSFSITIPAGMEIFENGQSISLSSLKKGDLLCVVLNEDDGSVQSVEKVQQA